MSAATSLVLGGIAGALLVPRLTRRGLRELQQRPQLPRWLVLQAAALGIAVVAAVTIVWSDRGHVAAVPAAVSWSGAVVALALCDALTRRLPTALTRQATVVVAALLVGAGTVSGDWRSIALAVAWAASAATVFHVAVLVAGVGRGDLRLAVLGGLGMGYANVTGLLLGIVVWMLFVGGQALTTILRGGSRKDQVPLGPGLVAGFLTAALASG